MNRVILNNAFRLVFTGALIAVALVPVFYFNLYPYFFDLRYREEAKKVFDNYKNDIHNAFLNKIKDDRDKKNDS